MKINTELHYATVENRDDIPSLSFEYSNELLGFILAEASYEVVHLVSIDNNVFASHDIAQIVKFIENYKDYLKDGIDVFWQEYKSYEGAYEVALMMQETSVFCYDK